MLRSKKLVDILNEKLVVLSMGAGVQSSCLLLMACAGEIEKPDHVVFADTQWEPKSVYKQLEYLREQAEQAGIGFHVVSRGDIREDFKLISTDKVHLTSPPLFAKKNGEVGMIPRQCTREYKIYPVRRKIRELQSNRSQPVEMWLGISWDEVQRMKPAPVQWLKHRWPLIEKRMRRDQCIKWILDHGHPEPPKSACIGCPFHSNAGWLEMKKNDPESWASAVEADKAIRNGWGKLKGQAYLHSSGEPLDEVPLEYRGQLDLWPNECEGMCGL